MYGSRGSRSQYKEKVIVINRVSKVVKGGKRFSFNALIVLGDGNGKLGSAIGKANDVSDAIQKGVERAKKEMITVPLKGKTIPYSVTGNFGASKIILKPAVPGTGLIAGGPMRPVLECAGIKDILAKSLGSNNPFNVVYATFNGLRQIKTEEEVRRIRGKEEVTNESA